LYLKKKTLISLVEEKDLKVMKKKPRLRKEKSHTSKGRKS